MTKHLVPFVDLSIVVPAYNEEHRILPTLRALHEHLSAQPLRYEILVVDDGSKDKTSASACCRRAARSA